MPPLPHFHLARVGSTLTEAWAMVDGTASKGEDPPFWLTTDEQTEGRGRMARSWMSAPGNLYATYLGPAPSPNVMGLLPFAVSLALYDTTARHLPKERLAALALKWPNDVLIDGAKTSGILIEHKQTARYGALIAIGIGLNVERAPDIPGRSTTCLHQEGATVTAGAVFASLRESVALRLQSLEHAPDAILPAWSQHATGLGNPITVTLGDEVIEGTFDHLASDGALMIRLATGAIRPIRTGDIVLRRT